MRFSIMASPSIMLDCAQYFEAKEEFDKAVQLYHKGTGAYFIYTVQLLCFLGGDLPRALDLCFRAGNESALDPAKKAQSAALFEMVNAIAADLGMESAQFKRIA